MYHVDRLKKLFFQELYRRDHVSLYIIHRHYMDGYEQPYEDDCRYRDKEKNADNGFHDVSSETLETGFMSDAHDLRILLRYGKGYFFKRGFKGADKRLRFDPDKGN